MKNPIAMSQWEARTNMSQTCTLSLVGARRVLNTARSLMCLFGSFRRSHRDDRDDFKRLRINDHELILDKHVVGSAVVSGAVRYDEVIEAAILRNDLHDVIRHLFKVHARRDARPD